ncbi:MAG: type III-B CRISPR-associated protein Cas10/Cmr2 [Ktedonobacteraceae bacterium]|nr:type III-B CRISPR-associated protein Cas10/Cmr2 [Ktedonobacteraceae bacterium]
MKYLFLVSIGPVQEFIASARRTRDLQFGSWFLSELSRAAARAIDAQDGSALIFPAPESKKWLEDGDSFMVANRILALVELDPEEMAKRVHTAVFQRLHDIRNKAYQKIFRFGDRQIIAYQQIDDLVELMWVALPYEENPYHSVRRQVETLMAARKNTYAFQRVPWGDSVPKSSLDGQLESVISEKEYPDRRDSDSEKQRKVGLLYTRYGAGSAERLSGVDLLKRAGETAFDAHFPSTSHIASLSFLQRLERLNDARQQPLLTSWKAYVKKLEDLAILPLRETIHNAAAHPVLDRSDGALLFEGRIADVLGIPSTDTSLAATLQDANTSLQAFYHDLDKQFRTIGITKARPSTYYALLQADGDSMGDLIDALAEQKVERHQELSQALSRFAMDVRTIVGEDHQGALVYSGGDDVLALLPLHTVLACAVALKTRFQDTLKDLAAQAGCQPPTLSVGIAIVHHLDSLRDARRLARDAEHQAKHLDGKNALAITVSKRGGEDYRAVGKWGNIDVRLQQLVTYCRAASIPVGMAYELRDLVLRLSVPTKDRQYETLQEIIRLDTLRIFLRKLTVPAGKVPPEQVKEIEAFLRGQLGLPSQEQQEQQEISPDARKKGAMVSIETFINELIIAQMLAEAEELAYPTQGGMR